MFSSRRPLPDSMRSAVSLPTGIALVPAPPARPPPVRRPPDRPQRRQRRAAGRPFPVSAFPGFPGFADPGSPAGPGKLAEQAAYRNEVVVVHPAADARLKVPDQPGAGAAVEGANQVGAYVPAPPGT